MAINIDLCVTQSSTEAFLQQIAIKRDPICSVCYLFFKSKYDAFIFIVLSHIIIIEIISIIEIEIIITLHK